MRDWQNEFEAHILKRGIEYYENGNIEEIAKTDYGYSAIVCGTEEYQVDIYLKGNKLLDMECTCPYAEDGRHCKHMAAVLMAIEELKIENLNEGMPYYDIEAMVKEASKEELEKFLITELRNDILMQKRFKVLQQICWEAQKLKSTKKVSKRFLLHMKMRADLFHTTWRKSSETICITA